MSNKKTASEIEKYNETKGNAFFTDKGRAVAIDSFARLVANRLEILHKGGRLRDKDGNAMDATGTGLPLSETDRDEIFLAARVGVIRGKEEGKTFLETWKLASKEARAALYRITKCPTFHNRSRAVSAGEKAFFNFLETCDEETKQLSNEDRLDFSSPNSEQKSFPKLYKEARAALIELWSHKMAFHPYNRMKLDFKRQLETLSTLAREARDGNFILPHGRNRDTKEIKKLSLLALNIAKGREIENLSKPLPEITRQAAIGAVAPKASGTRQTKETCLIAGRNSTRAVFTESDWKAQTAVLFMEKTLPAVWRKLNAATPEQLEKLKNRFA